MVARVKSFEQRQAAARERERWVAVYRSAPDVFRAFEAAEDPEGRVAARLASLAGLASERVLELGSGTGWLTRRLAPLAASYVALEPSAAMLAAAAGPQPPGLLATVRGRGERLPFGSGTFTRLVASFVLLDLRASLRAAVMEEARRVLGPAPPRADSPRFWVIENHGTGEYQALRDLVDEEGGLGEATPLVRDLGFELVEVVETEYVFESANQTAAVLGAILGDEVRAELERRPRRRVGLELGLFAAL